MKNTFRVVLEVMLLAALVLGLAITIRALVINRLVFTGQPAQEVPTKVILHQSRLFT